jgi:hypothetical protein
MLRGMDLTDNQRACLRTLAAIAETRDSLELREQNAVLDARAEGLSWQKIAWALGRTGEGLRQRHGRMEA